MSRILVRRHPTRHGGIGLLGLLSLVLHARRQRHRLRSLDDHLLKDIGLTPETAAREAGKPIWDVPPSWLR
jgi:uncharacterized protein YjiS (DUF1127 family)